MRRAKLDKWREFFLSRQASPDVASTWSAYARPNIRLASSGVVADGSIPLTASKFGGDPDLPLGVPWPVRGAYQFTRDKDSVSEFAWEQRPLTFLAQINLHDIAVVGCDLPLPSSGMLLFFYDTEVQPWGFDPLDAPGSRVFYVSAEMPVERRASPLGPASKVKSIRCEASEGLPGWEWLAGRLRDQPGFSSEPFDAALERLTDDDWHLMGEDGHAFGGWADEIQAPMELECEMVSNGLNCGDGKAYSDPRVPQFQERSIDWRLLLQLDTDDDLNWMWGDGGKLYFWCREADMAGSRFGASWTILQCY